MGYRQLIEKQVTLAFNKVKDLATDVILTKKIDVEFNFSTNAITNDSTEIINTKCIINTIIKKSEDKERTIKTAMFNTLDIGDINQYATITIGTDTWNIGPKINSDSFLTVVELLRSS